MSPRSLLFSSDQETTRLLSQALQELEFEVEACTEIFADGADKAGMLDLYANPLIQGMTTNPTLMKKAGITDYEAFARDVLQTVRSKLRPRRANHW